MSQKPIPDMSKITMFRVKDKAEVMKYQTVDPNSKEPQGIDLLIHEYGEVNYFPFFPETFNLCGKIFSVNDPDVRYVEKVHGFQVPEVVSGKSMLVQFWNIDDISDSAFEQI